MEYEVGEKVMTARGIGTITKIYRDFDDIFPVLVCFKENAKEFFAPGQLESLDGSDIICDISNLI